MRVQTILLVAILLGLSALTVGAQVTAPLLDAPSPTRLTMPTADLAGTSSELAEAPAPSSDLTRPPDLQPALPIIPASLVIAAPPPSRRKIIDRKFIVLSALVFALTAMDVEMTQSCMRSGVCVELNPSLPHSRAGMYAVNTATNVGVIYLAFRRRDHGKKDWWIAPLIDIGSHVGGIGSNIRFLGK